MVVLLWELGVVLFEFFLELLFHLLGELVEDDDLFGTTGLVELDLADLDQVVVFIIGFGVFLHG